MEPVLFFSGQERFQTLLPYKPPFWIWLYLL
jgi:hypothetical protein